MEIRLPTQSVFLAGESREVDNLVKRARPIEDPGPRSRSLVPQTDQAAIAAARTLAVPETKIDYEAAAASYPPRTRTPADLYRQISNSDNLALSSRFVDVFA